MARNFSKKGLRRDLNFIDIINPETSLNNLIDGLVDIENESFTSVDLNPIRELRSTTMSNSDFLNIAGLAPRFVDENNILRIYKPLIKVKNRFDVAEFTIGDPQFFGGDGLTAKYFTNDQLDSDAALADNIFVGEPEATEIFWENGNFSFISFVPISSIFGGVSFTGYFKPTQTATWAIPISTTGFFTFEFDNGSGGYNLIARKSQLEYSFTVEAASGGATTLTLQSIPNARNILIGDRITSATIPQFNDTDNPIFVTGIDRNTGIITISEPLAAPIGAGSSLTFIFQFGLEGGSTTFSLGILEQYQAYKIRLRFWFPNESFVTAQMTRTLNVDLTLPSGFIDNFNYRYLYSEDYNLDPVLGDAGYGDFKLFFDNKIPFNGGTIGGVTGISDYQSFETLGKLAITYEPPGAYNQIKKRVATLSFLEGVRPISIGITDSIEIGNYVFGAGIAPLTRVNSVSINNSILLSVETISAQSNVNLTFIDHRGLGAIDASATWSSGSSTISNLSPTTISNIRVGDLVLANGSPNYNRVVTIGTTTVTTSKTFTSNPGTGVDAVVFFYRSNGLFNDSLLTYCNNVFSATTIVQSNSGSNTLTIDDDANLIPGQVVQFGSRIPAGTTILSIAPSGPDFIITLSANITDDIPSGQLITFAPAGTTDSKEICFPPKDTSPPFTATPLGLQTTTARPSIALAPPVGLVSEIKFVGLSAEGVTIESASSSDTYNRALTITDGIGNTYKILGTTT
jgi:hypothetical protein